MRITGVFSSAVLPSLSGRRMHRQRGIALAVALFLLILITLIGLVAIRGTSVQQRMTANFYDRELGFQSAEAALRAAQALLATTPPLDPAKYRDCIPGGTPCEANPFTDTNLDSAKIITVDSGVYDTEHTNASGQPQFVIERICTTCTTASDPSQCQSANCQSYGTQSGEAAVWYYRVTARSVNPDDSDFANRAVVTLQAMYAVPAP
jgi:type IV pilus assembly protein PilX